MKTLTLIALLVALGILYAAPAAWIVGVGLFGLWVGLQYWTLLLNTTGYREPVERAILEYNAQHSWKRPS